MSYGDLVEAVQTAFDEQERGSATQDVRIICPVCWERTGKPDHRGSLSVNKVTGWFYCHKCEAKGRLDEYADDDEWEDSAPPDEEPEFTLPYGYIALTPEYEDSYMFGEVVRNALARIGSWDVMMAAGVGVAQGRLVVPTFDRYGVLRGWVGRTTPGLSPAWKADAKYVYPKGFRRQFILYNESATVSSSDTPLAVVEGIFDALPHWPHAVACLGKPAYLQENLLQSCRRPLVIVLDGDAWELGRALSERLTLRGTPTSWVRIPHGVDPGDIAPGDFSGLVRQAAATPGQGVFAGF